MSPTKKIYDSIHGFIHFGEWECRFIDTVAFQRLHYIRQLGSAYLVYPGAVHSRFEHSFGVMEIATQIFDKLKPVEELSYWRQMLRLAALAHDLGHLPFSHAAEKVLLGDGGHEKWTVAILRSPQFAPIWEGLEKEFPRRDPLDAVTKLAVGAKKLSLPLSSEESLLSEIITGDFFGADRIDYLLRDAKYTGLSYGVFDYHQLIEMLTVLPDPVTQQPALGIEENGIESCEALLLARHFMFRRIYDHPSVKAFTYHLKRFMQASYAQTDFQRDLDHYLALTDNEVLTALSEAARTPTHPAHTDARAYFLRKKQVQPIPQPSEQTLGLSFPVLKGESIVPAHTLSSLRIPAGPKGWNYPST